MAQHATSEQADEVQTDSAADDSRGAGFADARERSRVESLGERILGSLLDRAHLMPPRLVGPLVAQEIASIGGSDVSIYLQDYDHAILQPLRGRGLAGDPVSIDDPWVGRAFTSDTPQEQEESDGSTRMYVPMLDGSDRVGVLALTLPDVDDTTGGSPSASRD